MTNQNGRQAVLASVLATQEAFSLKVLPTGSLIQAARVWKPKKLNCDDAILFFEKFLFSTCWAAICKRCHFVLKKFLMSYWTFDERW
jgi:hypothetical protein